MISNKFGSIYIANVKQVKLNPSKTLYQMAIRSGENITSNQGEIYSIRIDKKRYYSLII